MKKKIFIVLFLCMLFSSASPAETTYYIRINGGTAQQCNGLVDAPYPGSGKNQPCAWSHPYWALTSVGQWKIQGGDTIIIGPGNYMIGYGAPNTSGWCHSDYPWDCALPPLPSGADVQHPTRILGKGWDSGCANPPQLWGTQRVWQILNLNNAANVVISCLEITDHSGCIEHHADPSVRCQRDNYPYGDWASNGLVASNSANVTLKHLNIHGLASTGIRAGGLTNWTIEDVTIAANGWAGWDGDLAEGNDSNSGTITFNRVVIEWNGCAESWPGLIKSSCWSQSAGGYGDGFGTGATGGNWIFNDCIFRYNTSDGLDLLYVWESGSRITIKRTQSYGNAGNPLKINGAAAIENCLLVGNCGYFNGKSFTYYVDDCRALGNSLELTLRGGDTVSLINSTIIGEGDCLVSVQGEGSEGSRNLIFQNNIFMGGTEFLDPSDTTCYIYMDDSAAYTPQTDYNIVYHTKISSVPLSANDINQDPLFVNSSFSSFDPHLQAASPAINTGLPIGSLNGLIPTQDLEKRDRPAGAGVDRGAYEYGGIVTNLEPIPFGSMDTPVTGSTVSSSIAVTGWALDDLGVSSVKIYRESGGAMFYIGDAVFVEGARPDVASTYPQYPNHSRAGWGYMLLTNFLPNNGNGSFTLVAVARDGDGNGKTLGTASITCDNAHAVKPFGAIDTPVQGGVASGKAFVNWGWVLTPQPNSIATDGSFIDVYIDGVKVGHPVYNLYRSDIASLFPGYANSNGAVGYFLLDTTAYADGVHTIQWIATDSGGNSDGIGSRYFIINNNNNRTLSQTYHLN